MLLQHIPGWNEGKKLKLDGWDGWIKFEEDTFVDQEGAFFKLNNRHILSPNWQSFDSTGRSSQI